MDMFTYMVTITAGLGTLVYAGYALIPRPHKTTLISGPVMYSILGVGGRKFVMFGDQHDSRSDTCVEPGSIMIQDCLRQ